MSNDVEDKMNELLQLRNDCYVCLIGKMNDMESCVQELRKLVKSV